MSLAAPGIQGVDPELNRQQREPPVPTVFGSPSEHRHPPLQPAGEAVGWIPSNILIINLAKEYKASISRWIYFLMTKANHCRFRNALGTMLVVFHFPRLGFLVFCKT